jgi:hypothetical protein
MQSLNHERSTPHLTWMRSAVLLAPLCAVACAYGVEMDRDPGEGGSSGGSDDAGTGPGVDANEIQLFLTQHCVKCHGAGAAAGGLQDITNLERQIAEGRIIPNRPEESLLFRRLTDPSNPMPPLSETERPSEQAIGLMQVWIAEGALTGEDACDNTVIPFDVPGEAFNGMIATMRNDILELEAEDRPFARYLTLTHLHNAGMCQRDLDLYRDGLAKAVNSLSREPRLIRPQPVDADKTIYRVDLRDYGWDQNVNFPENNGDIWEAVVEVNPFAVRFTGLASDVLREQARTDVPFQTADSFIQIATGGVLDGVAVNLDFYNRIMAIPTTLAQLQEDVTGISDPQAEIDEGRVFRVILENSGVSQWNRAYDRFGGSTIGEYLYISHDFASASGDSNLFDDPIDFKSGGGEMIFSLPNGLQGYMLTDGDGEILREEAPSNVVTDPGQRDRRVRVGISCMACHNNGIITKRDEFYDFYNTSNNKNLFSETEHDSILKLFAAPDAGVQQQDLDAGRFRLALAALSINLENPEPIINTSWQFEDELSLTRVAAEFGVDEQSLGFDLKRLQDRVSKSLGSLANNGRLSRETFADTYKAALCLLLKNSKEEPDEPECAQFEGAEEEPGESDTATGAPTTG